MSELSSVHGAPPEGMECMAMYEDIDASNYVEYQTAPSMAWHPALYCADVAGGAVRVPPRRAPGRRVHDRAS